MPFGPVFFRPVPGFAREGKVVPRSVTAENSGNTTGRAEIAVASTIAVRAASVAPVSVSSGVPMHSASVAPITVASTVAGRALCIAPISVTSTVGVRSASVAPVSVATTLPARAASVAPVSVAVTMTAHKTTGPMAIPVTVTVAVRAASIAPLSAATTFNAISIDAIAGIDVASSFDALAASVAPLATATTVTALAPSLAPLHTTSSVAMLSASVAPIDVASTVYVLTWVAPDTAGTLAVGWSASTDLFNVSRYTNMPFNSVAVVDGVLTGLGSAGAYVLSGDDDAGTLIEASLTTDLSDNLDGPKGPQPVPNLRRSRELFAAVSGGPLRLTLRGNRGGNESRQTQGIPRTLSHLSTVRMKWGRGMEFRYSSITLANVNGSDFTLHDLKNAVDLMQRSI